MRIETLGNCTLYQGDCAKVLLTLEAGSIDLTVTSPPYDNLRKYNGYTFDFEAIATQLWRVTKPGGVVVWVVADATINGSETGTSFRQALYFMGLGFNLHDTMIYEKNGFRYPFPNRYHQVFEFMFVFCKGNLHMFNPICDRVTQWGDDRQYWSKREQDGTITFRDGKRIVQGSLAKRFNIWKYSNGKYNTSTDDASNNHPAIFPESLARDHIVSWSNPGDVVLDPMMGSGTTGKMAVLTQRRFIGIDISSEYVDLAHKRITAAQQQLRLPLE